MMRFRLLVALLLAMSVGLASLAQEDKKADEAERVHEGKKEEVEAKEGEKEKEPEEKEAKEKKPKEEEEVEEVVVTATKTEEDIRNVSKSVSVITRKDIERQKPSSVIELLRGIPSLRTVHQGGPGGIATLQIRGAKSSHTVLLLNGMPLMDPGSAGGDINTFLADLLPGDIERVEVLRGPQSTLYGSDAIGGVVNIITQEGKGKPGVSLVFEGGSHGTLKERVGLYGSLSKLPVFHRLDAYVSGLRYQSDGLPQLTDRYENTGFFSNIRLHLTEDLSIGSLFRTMNVHQHFDDSDWTTWEPIRDPNAWRDLNMLTWAFDVKHRVADFWDYKTYYAQTNFDRFLRDGLNPTEDPNSPPYWGWYWLKDSYRSETRDFELQHNFHFMDIDTFTIGFDHNLEKARVNSVALGSFGGVTDFDARMWDSALFIENQIRMWDRVFFTAGFRHDQHSTFGSIRTKNFTGAVIVPFTETKIKGSWGTGFKAPSLYQLYVPQYGSPDLLPEQSEGMDFGFVQPLWDDRINVDVTYFKNHFANLIAFDASFWPGRFANISKAFTEGWEIGVLVRPIERAYARFGYTYTRNVNREFGPDAGKMIPGVPKDMYGLTIGVNPIDPLNVLLDLSYTGDNIMAYRPTPGRDLMNNDYLKADLTVTYDVNQYLQVFARGENIFGDDLTEFGIPGPREWFFGGFRLKF